MPSTPRYLDLATWPRRDAYAYFRDFDKPFFNVCTRVDVTRLKAAAKHAAGGSFSLACHRIALQLTDSIEPFRYRIEDPGAEGPVGEPQVRVHDSVGGGLTVLRADESFGFAYLDPHDRYADFVAQGTAAIEAAKDPKSAFDPRMDDVAVIHFTTLPWIHFTSFSHARNWHRRGRATDSIPKIAFGRIDAERASDGTGQRLWMPLSVEVHHALMDGLHVGRYIAAFEAAMQEPEPFIDLGPTAQA